MITKTKKSNKNKLKLYVICTSPILVALAVTLVGLYILYINGHVNINKLAEVVTDWAAQVNTLISVVVTILAAVCVIIKIITVLQRQSK